MQRVNKRLIMPTILLLSLVGALSIAQQSANDGVDKEKIKALEERLAVVEKLKRVLLDDIAAVEKEYFYYQHDIVYSNKVVGKIYQDIRELEKNLKDKRIELAAEMKKLPEMSEIVARRTALYAKKRDLKESEQMINNEIRAEQYKAMKSTEKH